jgi:hypothetical protein
LLVAQRLKPLGDRLLATCGLVSEDFNHETCVACKRFRWAESYGLARCENAAPDRPEPATSGHSDCLPICIGTRFDRCNDIVPRG